ncbi:MAG: DeoR family transcriptional regulator [Minisyncoccia bacterium]|jgi:hypothetical protein
MEETGKNKLALKKAYEISYAIFRVCSRSTSAALKESLERQALSLLDAAVVGNYGLMATISGVIEHLVRFGSDVGLIHKANGETLAFQVGVLNAAIAGSEKPAEISEVPLGDIFDEQDVLFPAKRQHSEEAENAHNSANNAKAAMRQSAILEKIRQSGNCRIKDIQELLSGCSERTIRYDLQSLLEQNRIERVGGGGPAMLYRIRQESGNLSPVDAL